MRPYRVPPAYRDRWIGGVDPRLRRMLRACGLVHLVLLLVILVVPKPAKETRRRSVPHDRVARMLAAKRPPPPPRVTTPKPRATAKPKAARAAKTPKPKPATQQTAQRTTPKPRRTSKPTPPPVGAKGRAAGKAVAKQIEDTTANIDDMLAGLTGTVPAAAGSGSGSGSARGVASGVASGVGKVEGGRAAGALSSIDGLLEGTGAGKGASSRGVARSGIDVVDDGLATDGEAASAWGRDSRSLMAVVQRYKSGVKFCYDNALKKSPNMTGKITLQMDILASGAVSNLSVVGDTLGDPGLQRCILAQVRNWRFQAIESGTVRFTLPLVFSPPN